MGFAGGGTRVGVMAVIVVTALWIHTDGNAGGGLALALPECGMVWAWNGGGNAGVGNLTVGFVPQADAFSQPESDQMPEFIFCALQIGFLVIRQKKVTEC